jgi:hypothetical protein
MIVPSADRNLDAFPGAKVQSIPAVSLTSILNPHDLVDLIDSDVQGHEFVVFESAIDAVNAKVKRVHIGTHDEQVEAGLRDLFRSHGWKNVHDYPMGKTVETEYGPVRFDDGVQGWINPRLTAR